MFHYDRFDDRKPQFNIDGKSKNIVDILLDFNDIRVPVEIKHANLKLTAREEGQIEDYVKLLGCEFGILTTGVEWRLYQCVNDGMLIVAHFRLDVDKPADIAEQAYVFTKEAIKGGQTSKQAELAAYLQAGNIADALVSKRVLSAIRLEMKDKHGCNLDETDIRNVLMGEVVVSKLLRPVTL
jgi:hypothetical protein